MLCTWKNLRIRLAVLSKLHPHITPLPDEEHRAPAALLGLAVARGGPRGPQDHHSAGPTVQPRGRTDIVPSSPLPAVPKALSSSLATTPNLFETEHQGCVHQGDISFWPRGKKDSWWRPYRNPVTVVGFSSKEHAKCLCKLQLAETVMGGVLFLSKRP